MLYEDQAGRFDERAGVPAEACAAIADVLSEMVASEPGQTWLEIGAGTGTLSLALIPHPIRYVGFDRPSAMLAVFRGKLGQEGLHAQLEVADGNYEKRNNMINVDCFTFPVERARAGNKHV